MNPEEPQQIGEKIPQVVLFLATGASEPLIRFHQDGQAGIFPFGYPIFQEIRLGVRQLSLRGVRYVIFLLGGIMLVQDYEIFRQHDVMSLMDIPSLFRSEIP